MMWLGLLMNEAGGGGGGGGDVGGGDAGDAGGAADATLMKQATAPDWSKLIQPDGTFAPEAYEAGLDRQWKSLGSITESYKELQRFKFSRPAEDWAPERVQQFRQAMGVPEAGTAEAYGLTVPDEMKDVLTPAKLDRIAAKANALHVPADALQQIFAEYVETEKEAMAAWNSEREQDMMSRLERLRKAPEFAGDREQAARETATNATLHLANKLGVDAQDPELLELTRSPLFMRMMHRVADTFAQDSTGGFRVVADLRSNEEKATDIMTNPSNPEYKLFHSQDVATRQKVLRLMGAPA